MNIFALDNDPQIAAESHCDKHVWKMFLEACQMMSTAHWEARGSSVRLHRIMMPAFENHPCTKWVRESTSNYDWTWRLAAQLRIEAELRFSTRSLSAQETLAELRRMPCIVDQGLTPFARAFGKLSRDLEAQPDTIQAYRTYYRTKRFASWKSVRLPPHWWQATSPPAPK